MRFWAVKSAAGVVAEHDVGVDELARPVHEDHRHAVVAVARQVALVAPRRRDDEAVEAPGAEGLGEAALALGVIVGAAGDGQHAAAPGHLLHPAMHRGEEGVGDVLEDQADARGQPVGAP
jgi:hypothetical protein